MHRLRFVAAFAVIGTLMCASTAFAQAKADRGWFDLGVGIQSPAEKTFTASWAPTIFGQPATFTTDYTLGPALTFGIGAGAMFHKRFGVGATFTNSHEAGDPATMSAHVPHPFFLNAYGNATAQSPSAMSRTERDFHIHAMFVAMDNGKIRIRAFGGPSYIMMAQDVIEDFAVSQSLNGTTNTITIGGSDVIETTASTWGFHVGGDVAYFFSKSVGAGGFVRYVNGSVDVTNPIAQTGQITLKVGGVQVGGALNVKF